VSCACHHNIISVYLGEQMLTPVLELGPPGLQFLRPIELRLIKPDGACPRTVKLKSSEDSSWKEMSIDSGRSSTPDDVTTIFVNKF